MSTPLRMIIAATALTACGTVPDDGWSGQILDSAGITVVVNPAEPLWAPEEGWWVEESLRIRADETVPETLLGYVADAALGDDGRIYVLDQQARAVRVFGPDGSPAGTLGGPGEGPGELGGLATSVLAVGDELLVVDWVQHRLTRYHVPSAAVLTPVRLPHPPGARSWWDDGADGQVYFRTLVRTRDGDGGWGGEDHLLRWTGGTGADTVLTFTYPQTDLGAPGSPRLPPVVNSPAWTVLADGTVAWTTLTAAEVRLVAPDGGFRVVRSEAWTPHVPSRAEEEALVRAVAARLVVLGGSASTVDEIPVDPPETLPVLTDVRAGPEATLWVQRAGPLRNVHPMAVNTPDPARGWGGASWEVLDRSGRYLGTVDLPPRFRVMAIRGDTILGVQADARLVDEVVRLNLHRSGPP